jgi:hypothetical protein
MELVEQFRSATLDTGLQRREKRREGSASFLEDSAAWC